MARARSGYPTPPNTPRKSRSRSMLDVRNLIAGARAGYRVGKALRNMYSGGEKATRTIVESTTTHGDKNNISLRKNKKRVRIAKTRFRAAKKIATQLTRLRPNRTYGTTHHFTGLVVNANLSGLVTNRDGQTQSTVGSVGMQSVTVIPICTFSKTDQKPANDINNVIEISSMEMSGDSRQKLKYKILFKSVFFEMMIKNHSPDNAAYVDVYFWKCRRRCQIDVGDLIPSSDAQVGQDGPEVQQYRNYYIDSYGWTPFQNKDIMKYIRIFKKERYFLGPNGVAQLEMRARINKTYTKEQTIADDMNSVQVKMAPGLSMGLICIAYGTPQAPDYNNGNNQITGHHHVSYAINKNVYWQNLNTLGDPEEEEERAIIGRL